jgi:hypothetical protein
MRAVVEFTHAQGERLPRPSGATDGELLSWGIRDSRSHIVSLKKLGSRDEELARLYAARLVAIGPQVIRLSGLERCGSAWVHQEWICTLRKS